MLSKEDRLLGGILGLLVGDAVGVPYEFNDAAKLKKLPYIDIEPPIGFIKTYRKVPIGTWSDDGAQALCLLDSLVTKGKLDIDDFASRLLRWYKEGLWAVDNYVYDVGNQTILALKAYMQGTEPLNVGMVKPQGKGNGALMRVLPLALWHKGTDEELIKAAELQARVTHGHICHGICCALYCLWARRLLNGLEMEPAYMDAVEVLRRFYSKGSIYRNVLEDEVRPDAAPAGTGRGTVVDTLHSARSVLFQNTTYEDVVIQAILLGDDTDTTACVAGGLAGVYYGVNAIPDRWMSKMRGLELVEPLIQRFLARAFI